MALVANEINVEVVKVDVAGVRSEVNAKGRPADRRIHVVSSDAAEDRSEINRAT